MSKFLHKNKTKIMVTICLLCVGITVTTLFIMSSSLTKSKNMVSSSDITKDGNNGNYTVSNLADMVDDIEEQLNDYWETIYPVGSIYISKNNTSPETLFGGEWVVYGSGRTLVGVDSNDADFDTAEETGGNKTISYTPSGTVGNTTLTTAQIPSHTHNYVKPTGVASHTLTVAQLPSHQHKGYSASSVLTNGGNQWRGIDGGNKTTGGYGTQATGGGGGHNHGLNTSTVASDAAGGGGAHNHSFSGTAASLNTVQPYITVYMWKRVA